MTRSFMFCGIDAHVVLHQLIKFLFGRAISVEESVDRIDKAVIDLLTPGQNSDIQAIHTNRTL